MTDYTLRQLVDSIYAAFGRNAPGTNTAAYESIARRTSYIPDDASSDILAAIEERDSLPVNVGKEIRAQYSVWREAHPSLAPAKEYCRWCHNGYRVFVSQAQPQGAYVRCTCDGGSLDQLNAIRNAGAVEVQPGELPIVVSQRYGWLIVPDDSNPQGAFKDGISATVARIQPNAQEARA